MANTEPYGWGSYRLNLIVQYHAVGTTDTRIEELIGKSEFDEENNPRPSHLEQWGLLNEIELRLFKLLPAEQLKAETNRKFRQAASIPLADVDARKADFEAAPDEPSRQAVAIALLEDMFVRYSYRDANREKRRLVASRLTWVGLPLIFVLALLILLSAIVPLTPEYSDFSALIVVMYFGALGAYFSRLFSFSSRMGEMDWNEMDMVYSGRSISVRLLVGAIAAVVLYFLMRGEILSGRLFLDNGFKLWALDGDQFALPLRPSDDFARLIVWSTLAGFSERFVADRLGEVEKSAKGSGNPNG